MIIKNKNFSPLNKIRDLVLPCQLNNNSRSNEQFLAGKNVSTLGNNRTSLKD
jgi:hypothetical protein